MNNLWGPLHGGPPEQKFAEVESKCGINGVLCIQV